MAPRWERIASPPPAGEKLFMDAVLRPHRSLSLAAFKLMLLVVIVFNVAIALVFLLHGAFPVAGFLGLDVLALWIAFRVNYRAGRVEERIRVEREQIYVERREPNGDSRHWVTSPVWAKAAADARGVAIRSGRGALRIASFLSPQERAAFAEALDEALWRAKRGS